MDPTGEMYLIADELRSIADMGLHYAENDYDRERYHRALLLSARLVAAVEKRPADDVMEEYEGSFAHATPYVCADAAVFRDGRILLIRREDNGLWAMPGGVTEVGETWAQSVERELREETGVEGTARVCSASSTPAYGAAASSFSYMSACGSLKSATIRRRSRARRRPG